MKLEELSKNKEKVPDELHLRGGKTPIKIAVGMGTSSIVARIRDVLRKDISGRNIEKKINQRHS